MKKLLGLLFALGLALPTWPQTQPKPEPSPTPHATAPATTPGPCSSDYYRNVNGVCVHRPVKTQNSLCQRGPLPSAVTDRIRLANTDGGHAITTAELRSGCDLSMGLTNDLSDPLGVAHAFVSRLKS